MSLFILPPSLLGGLDADRKEGKTALVPSPKQNTFTLGKTSIKKRFLSGIARIMGVGGGLPMPEFFGPFS